jgi:hypothetical protein
MRYRFWGLKIFAPLALRSTIFSGGVSSNYRINVLVLVQKIIEADFVHL